MRKLTIIRISYTLWVFVALLFGVNLYFSENANLDDPIVAVEISIAKDMLWLTIVFVCFFVGRRTLWNKGILFEFFIVTIFCIIEGLIIYIVLGELDVTYIKIFKNLFLYVAITFILINIIVEAGLEKNFLYMLHTAMLVSIGVSLVFYFFYPVQSSTQRLFGTYGNPNVAGFIVVYCIALYYMLEQNQRTKLRLLGTFALGGTALLLSGSISAFLALVMLIPLVGIFWVSIHRHIKLSSVVTSLLIFVGFLFCGVLLFFSLSSFLEENPLEVRLTSILAGGLENDTIAIRIRDFMRVLDSDCQHDINVILFGCLPDFYERMDSTIVSFGYNFGLMGLLIVVLIIIVPYFKFLSVPRYFFSSAPVARLPWLLALLTVVIIFSLPIQHSFEIFPSNFLFSSLISILILDLRKYNIDRKKHEGRSGFFLLPRKIIKSIES